MANSNPTLNGPDAPSADPDDYIYDLGSLHRQISTKSKRAQIWFDRGLIWTYSFNHEAAIECYEQAIANDPDCAMAYWGLAYALGPNYNKPWELFDQDELQTTLREASHAANQAKEKVSGATPVEQALATAMQSRYPLQQAAKDCSSWNKAYADAMEAVYHKFSDDLDVATLYADALMNMKPWQLWDIRTGKPTEGSRAEEAKDVLHRALAQPGALEHPGLLHLYIHLMEMSTTPELALNVADCLRGLVPDAGHLQHMPTHLDILIGDYRRAIASNSDAIRADNKYLAKAGAVNFYTLYRGHNYHFRIYAALFAGQSKVALDTVAELEASIPEELLRIKSPPMADWMEGLLAMRVHSLVRFGRWQELINQGLPSDPNVYSVTIAMLHYGKGVAYAATAKLQEAETERSAFCQAVKRVKPSRMLFNNTCLDILAVAGVMLDAELEYRHNRFESAFGLFRRAIELNDSLPYDEPWGWMQPVRHAYGALLVEQCHIEEAAHVYAADLGLDDTLPRARQHPNNVWALHGYHECLRKLGRTTEARLLEPQLILAKAVADIPITSSCFCRLTSRDSALR